MRATRSRSRGISLVEALVALAVMAFGTLAVLGVQTSLRLNGDIAKQRSEAVRIAQETMEDLRSFQSLNDYRNRIASAADQAVQGYATANTTYTLTTRVTDTAAADPAHPRRKGVVVQVDWLDRSGQAQRVQLNGLIEGTLPALAGSLSVPATRSIVRQPGGRHPAIPRSAVPAQDGTDSSKFAPPGSADTWWVFDNVTADITRICSDEALVNCVAIDARLLRGFVRFATAAAPPTAANALVPPGNAQAVGVVVQQTWPAAANVACFEADIDASTREYFCAIEVEAPGNWTGKAVVDIAPLAANVADSDAAAYRVCRYTPVAGCHPAVGSEIWGFPGETASCIEPSPQTNPPTPGRLMRNEEHPLDYDNVSGPLVDQNFLVVRAGNGLAAYDCPGDIAGDFLDTNTWHHQPSN